MKKILLPEKAKVTPQEVLDEINKFEHINKSPYSSTYYNMPGISWDYKPEGSLRMSDHWNFTSRGEKHCLLEGTDKLVENRWILAKYIEGKYHIIKEFGGNVPGYRFIEVNKKELELLEALYEMGGIAISNDWYKKYQVRPELASETHTKNRKVLSKGIGLERLKKFKEENKSVKKVIYIEEKYMESLEIAFKVYHKSDVFESYSETQQGINELDNKYKIYDDIDENRESFDKIYTLVLDNGMAIDFTSEQIDSLR